MKKINKKSLGEELIGALEDAIKNKDKMKIVRPKINLTKVRKDLNMTQSEFSKRFHINLKTLRQWEQGVRSPDSTSLAYLECIEKAPGIISDILNKAN